LPGRSWWSDSEPWQAICCPASRACIRLRRKP